MAGQPYTLVLLRHGESDWNAKNLFTGWVDVDLSAKGRVEATRGGQLLTERGLLPDVVHTSVLRRAISTAQLSLDACDRQWIPARRSWRSSSVKPSGSTRCRRAPVLAASRITLPVLGGISG